MMFKNIFFLIDISIDMLDDYDELTFTAVQ